MHCDEAQVQHNGTNTYRECRAHKRSTVLYFLEIARKNNFFFNSFQIFTQYAIHNSPHLEQMYAYCVVQLQEEQVRGEMENTEKINISPAKLYAFRIGAQHFNIRLRWKTKTSDEPIDIQVDIDVFNSPILTDTPASPAPFSPHLILVPFSHLKRYTDINVFS